MSFSLCVYWLCVLLSLCVSLSFSVCCCASLSACASLLVASLCVPVSSSLSAHLCIHLFILSLLVHSNNTVTSCYFFNNLARLSNRCVVYIVPVHVRPCLYTCVCVYCSTYMCISWYCMYTIIVFVVIVIVCIVVMLCASLSLCVCVCVCRCAVPLRVCCTCTPAVLCGLAVCVYRSSALGKSVCLLFF